MIDSLPFDQRVLVDDNNTIHALAQNYTQKERFEFRLESPGQRGNTLVGIEEVCVGDRNGEH